MSHERGSPLHVFFFPFMAPGHVIPMVEMAKLFLARGCRSTLIATPSCLPLLARSGEKAEDSWLGINVAVVRLPLREVGLVEDWEDKLQAAMLPDARARFMKAVTMLDKQLGKLLEDMRPDCLISDMFLPWTVDVAAEFGIPRVVFHGLGYFSLGGAETVWRTAPHEKVTSDFEPFVIPDFPGEISLTRLQLPDFIRGSTEFSKFISIVKESEKRSFGVVVNSFCELEPAYADYYKQVLGKTAWSIGPITLFNRWNAGRSLGENHEETSRNQHECLKWLDMKRSNTVVYVCFGSMAEFNPAQLHEIALGLEASGQQFLWFIKKDPNVEEGKEDWLPKGYEVRTAQRGLIIRGWAPQVMILEHRAIGGFVTHCGWNSTLEAVSAGVPMVTWPVEAEQFYNEKLVTQVLRIGIPVGVKQWVRSSGDFVSGELIENAVSRIMTGQEMEQMRIRSRWLAVLAKKAVEEGGSSYADLDRFIEKLWPHRLGTNPDIYRHQSDLRPLRVHVLSSNNKLVDYAVYLYGRKPENLAHSPAIWSSPHFRYIVPPPDFV